MKKNLSKTLAMMIILSNIGVVSTTRVLANPKEIGMSEVNESLNNKLNFCPSLLGVEKSKEKNQYLIKFSDTTKVREYIDSATNVEVNGVEYKKSYGLSNNEYIFSANFGGLVLSDTSLKDGENIIIIKADGYMDNIIKIKFDGTFIEQQGINKEKELRKEEKNNKEKIEKINISNKTDEKKQIKDFKSNEENIILSDLNNNLQDGVYTLEFNTYKVDSDESSMLGGFFDKNVKLEVKNKKMTLTFLNTFFSEMMIDFRLSSDENFPVSIRKNIAEIGKNGQSNGQTITVPVTDLTKTNIVGVLVTAMGGQKSDIGNMDQYRKARIIFKPKYKKGWIGFNKFNNQISDDEVLDKALIDQHLDINKDGKISEEELNQASGTIDLSGCKIKDISKLKYLGKNVKKLILGGNEIETLPIGVFDNLTNLENLTLNNNSITVIPKGIFDKLINLKSIQLGNNKIKYIEEGTFDELRNLKSISLNYNYLKNLPDGIFKNLSLLEGLYLDNNNLEKMPESLSNLKNITSISINNNNLEEIPNELGEFSNLKRLSLQHNKINKIPNSIYKIKKLIEFNIKDNEILDIPKNIDEIFEKANIDISLNNIITDNMANLERLTIKPQKIQSKTLIKAEDGLVTMESKVSPLDLLCWDKFWDRSLPNNKFANIEDYKKYLNGKSVVDVLNSRNFDWTIKTDIQKKDKNGQYKTLKSIVEEEETYKPIKYIDKNMKNGHEYRIITTVLVSKSSTKELGFTKFDYGVAIINKNENVPLREEIKENKVLLYSIKNSIEDTSEIGKSMVRKVLKDITKVEKINEKNFLTFHMNTQGYLKDIHIFIDGQEVTYEEIKGEGHNLKIKVQTLEEDSKVGMKMFVIPMNRYVEFSIAHDKNTLKLINENEHENNKKNKEISSEKTLSIKEKKTVEEVSDNINNLSQLLDEEKNISDNYGNNEMKTIHSDNIVLPMTGQPIGANILSVLGSGIFGLGVLLKRKNRK